MRPKITKNIPALISAILAGIAGLLGAVPIAQNYYGVDFSGGDALAIAFGLIPYLSVFLVLAVAILAFVKFNKMLNAGLIWTGFVFVGLVSNFFLMELARSGWFGQPMEISFIDAFWYTGTFEDTLISLGNVMWLLAAAAAVVSVLVKPRAAALDEVNVLSSEATQPNNQQPIGYDPQTGAPIYGQPVQTQPVGYDPHTGAPIYGQPGYMRPESQLPLIALIGGILFPLLGIIVGHIALGQMKRGEIPSSNMGLAKTGLILGYVFIGLGFLAVIAYVAIFAAFASSGLYF
jgi:Domain of unknown function (DUF4190)